MDTSKIVSWHFPDEDRDAPSNFGLLPIQTPDASVSLRIFCYILILSTSLALDSRLIWCYDAHQPFRIFHQWSVQLAWCVHPPYDDTPLLPCQLTVIGQVNVAVMSKACIVAKSESSLGQDAVTTLRFPQSLQRSSGQYLARTKITASKMISNLSFTTILPSLLYL
jgi:hypothetical protein